MVCNEFCVDSLEGIGSPKLQQLLDLRAVEAHYHLAVDYCHRRGHVTELLKFGKRRLIGSDVTVGELDVLL